MNADDIKELRNLLDSEEYDFRHECGVSKPVEMSDCHDTVNAFAMHYSLISVKAELDHMVKGLEAYGVYELLTVDVVS